MLELPSDQYEGVVELRAQYYYSLQRVSIDLNNNCIIAEYEGINIV